MAHFAPTCLEKMREPGHNLPHSAEEAQKNGIACVFLRNVDVEILRTPRTEIKKAPPCAYNYEKSLDRGRGFLGICVLLVIRSSVFIIHKRPTGAYFVCRRI